MSVLMNSKISKKQKSLNELAIENNTGYKKKNTISVVELKKMKSLTNSQALQLMKNGYGLNMTKAGLIYWNKKYALGKKVFGQWAINTSRLLQLLKSREDVINGNL
jgi:hypothetical protein